MKKNVRVAAFVQPDAPDVLPIMAEKSLRIPMKRIVSSAVIAYLFARPGPLFIQNWPWMNLPKSIETSTMKPKRSFAFSRKDAVTVIFWIKKSLKKTLNFSWKPVDGRRLEATFKTWKLLFTRIRPKSQNYRIWPLIISSGSGIG